MTIGEKLKSGDKAPNFTLPIALDKHINLKEYILAFIYINLFSN